MAVFPILNGTEVVVITANLGNAEIFEAAGVSVTTTADIAALGGGGGGGGFTSQQIPLTGSSVTAILSQFVGFNSASGVPKTVNAPTSTGSLKTIMVADVFGDAYTNPITFVPATGSVVGGQNQVYTNFGSGTWVDTAAGWVQQ